jgi:hypothetical protein
MSKTVIAVTLGVAALLSGCVGDGADSLSTTEQKAVIDPAAWVNIRLEPVRAGVTGIQCAPWEVMIGIHLEQRRAICASILSFYHIFNTLTDPPNGTVVGQMPQMHGCPPGYFIQGVIPVGEDEYLSCAALSIDGVVQAFPTQLAMNKDGGNASVPTYGISPNMHVCPPGFAMMGIQQAQNALFCGN